MLFRLTAGVLVCKEELEPLPDSTLAHKGENEQQNEPASHIGPIQYKSPSPALTIRRDSQEQDTPSPVRVRD